MNAPAGQIAFRNSQGLEASGTLLHLTRKEVVFEVYNPYSIVQLSEVLSELRIIRGQRPIYEGRAVASNLVNTGIMLIVSATLVDSWIDIDLDLDPDSVAAETRLFVEDWRDARKSLLRRRSLLSGGRHQAVRPQHSSAPPGEETGRSSRARRCPG